LSDTDAGRTPAADKALAAIAEVERLLEATQRRALRLFGERGVLDWILLNEWLDAGAGSCGPATEFEERETQYVLRIALPGVDPASELASEPRELVIRSRREGGKRTRSGAPDRTGRRPAALPPGFRPETVKATLHNGVLTLIVPKAADAVMPLPGSRTAR
jgi:HSP20 family molecular chaperone IbpA